MEIYRTKYIVRRFDAGRGILYSTWSFNTELMTKEEFKTEMLMLPDQIGQYGAKFLLSNLQNLRFIIEPDLQTWLVQTIIPKFTEIGLRKQAIVVPEDFFTQIALEQTIDELEDVSHENQSRFFPSETEAEKWLI